MAASQSKRQKVATQNSATNESCESSVVKESASLSSEELSTNNNNHNKSSSYRISEIDNFGVDVDDLSDESDTDDSETDSDYAATEQRDVNSHVANHLDIREQLAAAGPAGVAAAAAIATARKRKRPHSFETNPSVRKRQQTRLIRKLRACIDEYTMRVGQQAVVLITMPGKAVHNFKVFGAQPLESVIRSCKQEIMGELEQALLEQAPQQFKEDGNRHELPPLVIDGIPTPVEKMTQAQLRAFIPLMLKYSTGRGKPGWGKDTTRPPWWPETLPWANVRSDARDENEKQRISWTTTLRQIVTNCYRYHGRDDLLPSFDEQSEAAEQAASAAAANAGSHHQHHIRVNRDHHHHHHHHHQSSLTGRTSNSNNNNNSGATVYTTSGTTAYSTGTFVHSLAATGGNDGTGGVSLIQVDPANAQILTLPDGTQVRAVRLQTLGGAELCGQQLAEIHEGTLDGATHTLTMSEASIGPNGQIILTGEDGTQSCYPMSSLVSIPASVYQQFAQAGQQLSIVSADGQPGGSLTIHAFQPGEGSQEQDPQQQQQQQQQSQQQVQQSQTTVCDESTTTIVASTEVANPVVDSDGQIIITEQQQQQQLNQPQEGAQEAIEARDDAQVT